MVYTGNTVTENAAVTGAGAFFFNADTLELSDNLFGCNRATSNRGAGTGAHVLDGTHTSITHNIFMDNDGAHGGGLYLDSDTTSDVVNNAFVGNDGNSYASAFLCNGCTADFVNNVVSANSGGPAVGLYMDGGTVTLSYNDWTDNDSDAYVDLSLAIGTDGNIDDVPDFTHYSQVGDCTNDDLTLQATSALIDAGHPLIFDTDGSASDIGPYGGGVVVPDADGDASPDEVDCDDTDPEIHPEADETCDGVDNDCDGDVDEDDAVDARTWYPDTDGDGQGDPDGPTTTACETPSGYSANAIDCDDTDPTVFHGAEETAYDGIDQDCDDADLTDVDEDGFDSTAVAGGDDCDDEDPAVNPAATETWYDGVDADCDGADDFDADGDGDPHSQHGGTDCDDRDPTVQSDCGGSADGGAPFEEDEETGAPDAACTSCWGQSASLLLAPLALAAGRRRRR
jgi:hypothetical protein